jgi:hypothetical protein
MGDRIDAQAPSMTDLEITPKRRELERVGDYNRKMRSVVEEHNRELKMFRPKPV